eukprot:scaffold9817_cov154-Skeletonema_menzelii.AAC.5
MYASNGSSLHIVRGDIRAIRRSSSKRSRSMVDDRRSVAHSEEYIDVNVRATAILYDALGQCGVRRRLFKLLQEACLDSVITITRI